MVGRRPVRRRNETASAPVILLSEILDLREATPLATALLACRGTDVTVDAGAVRRLGAQCLQVLLSAHASWQGDGKSLTITKSSPELSEALTQFGATSFLSFSD